MPSHDLRRMLRWDARSAVEELEIQEPAVLRRSLQADHRLRLTAVLSEMGDSYFGQGWDDFVRLVDGLDFALLQCTPYHLNGPGEQRIWIHSRGALLVADSYGGMTNQAKLWVCWKPVHPNYKLWPAGTHWADLQDDIWSGALDAHQGLKTRWQALLDSGRLLQPWPVALQPWPFHAGEKEPELAEQALDRLATWPAAARRLMGI